MILPLGQDPTINDGQRQVKMRDLLVKILPESVLVQLERESRSWYLTMPSFHEPGVRDGLSRFVDLAGWDMGYGGQPLTIAEFWNRCHRSTL